jgi:Na+-driven multidrug efflux pump
MEERWSNWIVPYEYCKRYIFLLICVLFILPFITGLRYTSTGYLINLLWADGMFYIWYKNKKRKEIELAQKRRKDKYFKDSE